MKQGLTVEALFPNIVDVRLEFKHFQDHCAVFLGINHDRAALAADIAVQLFF